METYKQTNSCFGCRSAITNKDCMSCCDCKQSYDLQCANISPKRFKKSSQETKRNWVCVECKSKRPKQDNSNTPVRFTHQLKVDDDTDVEFSSDNCNVTSRRRANPKTVTSDYITEAKLRDIWKNEMRKEIETVLEATIKRAVVHQLKTINDQCTEFKESLTYVSTQYEELRKEFSDLKKILGSTSTELKSIRDENKSLKENLSVCANRIKTLEEENLRQQQWVRMQNIEIIGIPEVSGEIPADLVKKVSARIGVKIETADLEFAHRVQPRHVASKSRGRPIIARLRLRSVKDQIIAAARNYRNLSSGDVGIGGEAVKIYVNEHLTKDNKMLLNSCKLKAKEVNYKFIWTKNCRIFVRKNETSPPIAINSKSDIAKIV